MPKMGRNTLSQQDPIKRNGLKMKKGRAPRKLTERRMELIKEFLKTAHISPEMYGEVGSKPWISGLIESLGEKKRNDVQVSDVKNWLASYPAFFRDAVPLKEEDGTFPNRPESSASTVKIRRFQNESDCEDEGSPGNKENENGIFKPEREDVERNLDATDGQSVNVTDESPLKHLIPAHLLQDVPPGSQLPRQSEEEMEEEGSPMLLFDQSRENVTIHGRFNRNLLHGLILYLQDLDFLPRHIHSISGKMMDAGLGLVYDVKALPNIDWDED